MRVGYLMCAINNASRCVVEELPDAFFGTIMCPMLCPYGDANDLACATHQIRRQRSPYAISLDNGILALVTNLQPRDTCLSGLFSIEIERHR